MFYKLYDKHNQVYTQRSKSTTYSINSKDVNKNYSWLKSERMLDGDGMIDLPTEKCS